jgi:hypothetical protein
MGNENDTHVETIVTSEFDGLDIHICVFSFKVQNGVNLHTAILDACREYCLTEEGKKTYEGNCNCFNWGDLDAHVPNVICEKHGFKKLDTVKADEHLFDEQLVNESDIIPEE